MDNDNILFSTLFNYQKVANEGSHTNTSTSYTVTHNLGAITSVRAWYDPNKGRRFPISEEQFFDDDGGASEVGLVTVKAYLTTNTLVFTLSTSSSVTLYWKIYYDS